MSAGICIMNKNAIALAADSAVTIGQHLAIHNSAMTSAELKHRVKVTVKPPRAGLPQQRPVSAGVAQTRRNQCSNLLPLGMGIAGFG